MSVEVLSELLNLKHGYVKIGIGKGQNKPIFGVLYK